MDQLIEALRGLDVVRTWQNASQIRAADEAEPLRDGSLGLMEVRFSTFGAWYEINSWWEGRFLERTKFGSFAKTIADHHARKVESAGVKSLFNHGGDFHIGDKLLGGIVSLTEEKDSPLGVVDLDDTSYNRDLLPGLKRGGYGSSFMFRVLREEWAEEPGVSAHNPEGLPERTITEVRLYEFGPVTWPANPASTAGMRCVSGTDAYYEGLRSRDPSGIDALRARFTELRSARNAPRTSPDGSAGPTTDPTRDAAPEPPIAPTSAGHPMGLTPAQRRERLYPSLRG